MDFKKSTVGDLPRIMKMVDDAKVWFKSKGIDQWQGGSPNRDTITDDINRGNSYVVSDGGKIVGHGALIFGEEPAFDKIYDGKWQSIEPYATVHRIVTAADSKRKGAASYIFYEFEKLCLKNGIFWLRVDTHKDNIPMQNLIGKCGYAKSGTVYYDDLQAERIAYEKQLN